MNREIKFRGKRTDNGEWVYGYLFPPLFGLIGIGGKSGYCTEVIPETIGQFTGLHDKNGKEIYEGDILNMGPSPFLGNIEYYEVKWNQDACRFCVSSKSISDGRFVCGNIHDNPELIK